MTRTARSFGRMSNRISSAMGSPWAALAALLVIVVWAATGPVFHFSETWQLVINTGTTIVTFLMVFVIQNTTNREMRALQLKLDGIIAGVEGVSNELIDIEELDDAQLALMTVRYHELAAELARRQSAEPPPKP